MGVNVRAVESKLCDKYMYRVDSPKTIAYEEILTRLASKTKGTLGSAQYFMDGLMNVMIEGLSANERLNLGFATVSLGIKGSTDSATDQPNPVRNPIVVELTPVGNFKDKVTMIELTNITETIAASLNIIQQTGTIGNNRIVSGGATVVINGSGLMLNPEAEDEGVAIIAADGSASYPGTIVKSDHATIHCTFATLPATGVHTLVVGTRDGHTAEEKIALKKLTRKVQVVNE